MKRFFILLLTVSLATGMAQTQSIQKSLVLTENLPENAGIASERLARIGKMCEEAVAEGQVPGIVTLVARNEKIVHRKAGVTDLFTTENTTIEESVKKLYLFLTILTIRLYTISAKFQSYPSKLVVLLN